MNPPNVLISRARGRNRQSHNDSSVDDGDRTRLLRGGYESSAANAPPAISKTSDARDSGTEARLQAKLAASAYPAVRGVCCTCEEGVLTLRGRLPNYYCAQVALSIVQGSLNGDTPIQNYLQVENRSLW